MIGCWEEFRILEAILLMDDILKLLFRMSFTSHRKNCILSGFLSMTFLLYFKKKNSKTTTKKTRVNWWNFCLELCTEIKKPPLWTSGWGLNTDPLDKAGAIFESFENMPYLPPQMSFPGKVLEDFLSKTPRKCWYLIRVKVCTCNMM